MKIKFKHVFSLIIICFSLFYSVDKSFANNECTVNAYIFYSNACPHCEKERIFLNKIKGKYEGLEIVELEVGDNRKNLKTFIEVGKYLKIRTGAVPFFIIGSDYILGFGTEETYGVQVENLIKKSLENPPEDIIEKVTMCEPRETPLITVKPQTQIEKEKPQIKVPIFGKIDTSKLSLPMLTFVIALLDGFNPCAMWVLLFLISLLLGMEDRKKMWVLGTVFIIASGFAYFLFLSAWLNFFLFIGFVTGIRYLVGLVALGTGGYYLYDFATNPRGACKVDVGGKKKKTFEKIKKITKNKNIFVAILGMILLAFAVNIVELLCSAGLPAVYTELLTLTPMSTLQYYSYLIFYILVFMIDDLVIFFIAMTTLRAVGIDGKFSHYSHLIGGIIMAIIGILMVFKPEILMFS